MKVDGKLHSIVIEKDRVCIESERKQSEPTSCRGCKYDTGHIDCSHPKVKSKNFGEWPMRECYKSHDMKNGKIVKKDTVHIPVVKK